MTKSTLLTLLDRFDGVIVFATNLFDNYDSAFLRRILFHVEFPLPDLAMRIDLWKLHFSENISKAVTYEKMAELSEGLKGGDIRSIVIRLALKLLAGKNEKIDEDMIRQEIERHNFVKKINQSSDAEVESSETLGGGSNPLMNPN